MYMLCHIYIIVLKFCLKLCFMLDFKHMILVQGSEEVREKFYLYHFVQVSISEVINKLFTSVMNTSLIEYNQFLIPFLIDNQS